MKTTTALVNGKRLALYRWGSPRKPPLVLLHGWMDSAACFDLMAEKLSRTHHVVGIDLHGFGRSSHTPLRTGYHFHALMADVHAVITQVLKAKRVVLVGHSMGGNIALYFAGMFPELVLRLVSIEGWGLPDGDLSKSVEKFREWVLATHDAPKPRTYKTLGDYLERLAKSAPRATAATLEKQSRHLVRKTKGGYRLRADAAHFLPEPDVYSAADFERFARLITIPTFLIYGGETLYAWGHELLKKTQKLIPGYDCTAVIEGAGHMMHYEAPEILGETIAAWLATRGN
jgi:pimeloyl-ACP methyl ester carboxylesterase